MDKPRLKMVMTQLVASYHVKYPPVTKRVKVKAIYVCIVHCLESPDCYYIIIAMDTDDDYICDITSVSEESGLELHDEGNYQWKVYSVA